MGRRSRGCLLLCLLPCLLRVFYLVCWMSVTLPVGCPLPCLLGVRYRGALSSDSRRGQRGPFLSAAAALSAGSAAECCVLYAAAGMAAVLEAPVESAWHTCRRAPPAQHIRSAAGFARQATRHRQGT